MPVVILGRGYYEQVRSVASNDQLIPLLRQDRPWVRGSKDAVVGRLGRQRRAEATRMEGARADQRDCTSRGMKRIAVRFRGLEMPRILSERETES